MAYADAFGTAARRAPRITSALVQTVVVLPDEPASPKEPTGRKAQLDRTDQRAYYRRVLLERKASRSRRGGYRDRHGQVGDVNILIATVVLSDVLFGTLAVLTVVGHRQFGPLLVGSPRACEVSAPQTGQRAALGVTVAKLADPSEGDALDWSVGVRFPWKDRFSPSAPRREDES
jgi:hypothetical protein